jgi:hypothetical protein
MKILFFGDMVGKAARMAIKRALPAYKKKYGYDVAIANCDNVAHGKGVTKNTLREIASFGIDIMTCGDHVWDTSESGEIIKSKKEFNFLCPANYPRFELDKGFRIFEVNGAKIMVINLIGRVFFQRYPDCPFRAADRIINENKGKVKVIVIDFHAEATSEKRALAQYLDSRVSAVCGTHTHVQTADNEVQKGGTAFISDVGMVGPKDSIIGCKKEVVIEQMISQIPFKYEISDDNSAIVNAVLMDIDEETGKAKSIERISEVLSDVF